MNVKQEKITTILFIYHNLTKFFLYMFFYLIFNAYFCAKVVTRAFRLRNRIRFRKVCGVGPIVNTPSTDKRDHFENIEIKKKIIIHIYMVTPDTWHRTPDTWHVPYEMWHMVGGEHSLKM